MSWCVVLSELALGCARTFFVGAHDPVFKASMGFLDRALVGAHPLPHEVTLGSGCTAFALARGSPNQLNNPKASFAQHGEVFSLRRESVSDPAWLEVS
jgi:hypothetical protein